MVYICIISDNCSCKHTDNGESSIIMFFFTILKPIYHDVAWHGLKKWQILVIIGLKMLLLLESNNYWLLVIY